MAVYLMVSPRNRLSWSTARPAVAAKPDCCLIHLAMSSAVANQTSGFAFM